MTSADGARADIGVFERVDLIRTLLRREAGKAELKTFDKHIFDQTLAYATSPKKVMVNTEANSETGQRNLWTWVMEEVHARARAEFGPEAEVAEWTEIRDLFGQDRASIEAFADYTGGAMWTSQSVSGDAPDHRNLRGGFVANVPIVPDSVHAVVGIETWRLERPMAPLLGAALREGPL